MPGDHHLDEDLAGIAIRDRYHPPGTPQPEPYNPFKNLEYEIETDDGMECEFENGIKICEKDIPGDDATEKEWKTSTQECENMDEDDKVKVGSHCEPKAVLENL